MATIFVCDECGLQEEAERGHLSDCMPRGWVRATGFGMQFPDWVMCSACASRLIPKWDRNPERGE